MSRAIMWFRQDLRVDDNPAFLEACQHHQEILPLYILDEACAPIGGAQRWWLHHSLTALSKRFSVLGNALCLKQGSALTILIDLIKKHQIDTIYWNRCYEPAVIERDTAIKQSLKEQGIRVISLNGSLLYEPWEIKTQTGSFFKVFTPYWRACLKLPVTPVSMNSIKIEPFPVPVESEQLDSWNLLPTNPDWAVEFKDHWQPGEEGALIKLEQFIATHLTGYDTARDRPAESATSKLSPHLHFGEISPWRIFQAIETCKQHQNCDLKSAERFLTELGWREFSYHLLYHVPLLPTENFKSEFNAFPWKNNLNYLARWQTGKTGYPIVDAGMRELWHTGYMHNRVRMIVASFLTKHLLIDWRHGASWFLDTLVDADLASNSASWQWVAGCGADAAPYFRIFNPVLQGEKFDPQGDYVKRWVPELNNVPAKWIHQPWAAPIVTLNYPKPIVDHQAARQAALSNYQLIRSG